jgi:hypothetical protein
MIATRPNFGHRQWVPPNPLFHTSVRTHMDDPNLKYIPKACYMEGTERYGS